MNYGSKHSELHRKLCNTKMIEKIAKNKYPLKLIGVVLKTLVNQQNQKNTKIHQKTNDTFSIKKSKLSICFQ